jgi:outer membrane biogenesis lipoprotein LolB
LVFLQYKTPVEMKTRFLLFAIACLSLAACNSSSSDQKAARQKADSLAEVAHMDSLINAGRNMHTQDSINAAQKDTSKKIDTTKK